MPAYSPNKVVVPLDFSSATENAIKQAVTLVEDTSKLYFLHVLPPLEALSPGAVWGVVDDGKRRQSAQEFGLKYLHEFEHAEFGDVNFEIRLGQPALEITDYARELEAELILVSSHGYHGMKRMLLGSVAESVIRHAHCAVFVLRRPDAE